MHEIFLSHSGSQKDFARALHEALQKAGQIPFFDEKSLKRGEFFPPAIFKALEECSVGVVVLSKEFMESHWPMKELGFLYSRPKRPIIYPIFYKLAPTDLNSKNLEEWRSVWKELEERHSQLDTGSWEEAVQELRTRSGEVLRQDVSEAAFISKIVGEISKMVAIPLPYDEIGLRGQDRLKELMVGRFKDAESLCRSTSHACVIGVYGVAGGGKTTLCRLLCNRFFPSYRGKSICLEFPSAADNSKILGECKRLLKECCDASVKHVVEKIDSLEKVFPQLREWLRQQDVFVAVDNVWESSAEAAGRLLEVEFGRGSKIMITSRSKVVLESVMKGCDHATCIREVPSLEKADALSILKSSFDGDLSSLSDSPLLDQLVAKCVFNGAYHPYVLRALGRIMRRRLLESRAVGEVESKAVLEEVISELRGSTFDPWTEREIVSLLGKDYGEMSPTKQHIFLDVAVLFLGWLQTKHRFADIRRWCKSYEGITKGLSALYDRSEVDMKNLICELEADGLLERRRFKDLRMGKEEPWQCERVQVHDLYADLAMKEAEKSGRFVFGDKWNSGNVQLAFRGFVSEEHYEDLIRCGRGHQLDNLEVLIVVGEFSERMVQQRLCIDGMVALRMLLVNAWGSNVAWGVALINLHTKKCSGSRLVWMCVSGCGLDVFNAEKLEVLVLDDVRMFCERLGWRRPLGKLVIDMMNCNKLRHFVARRCPHLREIRGAGLCDLGVVEVTKCQRLHTLDLNGLRKLASIDISDCHQLRTLDLNGLSSLQSISIIFCPKVAVISSWDQLSNLQSIDISYSGNINALPAWDQLSSLQSIRISHLGNISALPAWDQLFNLQSIDISHFGNILALPAWDQLSNLQSIRIFYLGNISALPAWDQLSNLQSIEISHLGNISALPAWDQLSNLQSIEISHLGNISALPAWDQLSNLQSIDISDLGNITALPAWDQLSNLQSIRISHLGNVTALPAWDQLSNLQSIDISHLGNITALPRWDQLSNLELVSIMSCNNLRDNYWKSIDTRRPFQPTSATTSRRHHRFQS